MRTILRRLGRRALGALVGFIAFLTGGFLLLYPIGFHVVNRVDIGFPPLQFIPSATVYRRVMRQLSWRYGVHPVWRETIGYLVRTLTFRLGTALTYPATTIWHQASIALPTTLALVLGSALIGIAMGATLGIVAAWKAHSRIDRTLGMIADICRGLPALVTAVLAIWLFGSLIPGLLAVHGWGRTSSDVLPIAVLTMPSFGRVFHRFRGGFREAFRQNYLTTAAAKGIGYRGRILHHALANAAMDLLRVIGPILALTVVSAVWVENLFVVPGLGSLVSIGAANVDGPLLMSSLFILLLLAMAMRTVGDLAYWLADPRVRLGHRMGDVDDRTPG